MITMISFIVGRRFDMSAAKMSFNGNIDNNKSLSDGDYGMNHYSGNVDGIAESRWNVNDDVEHHLQHDVFRVSNGMYLGNNDENYLIIDDENVRQIDHDKRAKVKEVKFRYENVNA